MIDAQDWQNKNMMFGHKHMPQVRLLNVDKVKFGKKKPKLKKVLKPIIQKKINQDYTDGSQDKVVKVNHKDGLTVIPVVQILTVKKHVNRVVEVKVKIEQNIPLVDQHHPHVELKVKVKNGVKRHQ